MGLPMCLPRQVVFVHEKTARGWKKRLIYPKGGKTERKSFNPSGTQIIEQNNLDALETLPRFEPNRKVTFGFRDGDFHNPLGRARQPHDKGHHARKSWQK